MRNRLMILLFFILESFHLFPQSNIRVNDYWDNFYYINPASIHDQYKGEIGMTARKQWVNFPGSPATFFAHATVYFSNLNTQFGLKALADKIGYTNVYNFDFSYAYHLLLNTDWRLNMGLTLSYQGLNYDLSEINLLNGDDPVAYEHIKFESNFNSNVGLEFNNKYWKFGFVSQNIFSLFMHINGLFPNTNFLYANYRQYSDNFFNLGGGLCGIQYKNMFQMEFNLNSYFKVTPQNNIFQIGLFYRTWYEMGLLLGIDVTSTFHLSYSYDFNVSNIRRHSIGTHELMLTYKFKEKPPCINCWY